jgi:riboflavin transporter FmnP
MRSINTAKQSAITANDITITAVLLAIILISQVFKNTSQFITGPIVNTCIILAVLASGLVSGLILSVISPVTSFFITASPIIAAAPVILPFIMIGNAILAVSVWFFTKRKDTKVRELIGFGVGSAVKAGFMAIFISYIVLPFFLPAPMQVKVLPTGITMLQTAQTMFSIFQLITALIGSAYAFILWIPLKKVLHEIN